jgi:hypothetical protein
MTERTSELHSMSALGQAYRIFDKDRAKLGAVLRSKDQCLIQRRKTNLTEIKVMATMQEIRIDSRELILTISYTSSI